MTDDQRALAERYLPLAAALAERWAARVPNHDDDLHGAARLALSQAARTFDPRRGVKFATFARMRVQGALVDYVRKEFPKGYRNRGEPPRLWGLEPEAEAFGRVLGATPDAPVGEGLVLEDLFGRVAEGLGERQRRVFTMIYLEGRAPIQVARALGISRCRVAALRREVLEALEGLDPTTLL